MEMIELTIDQFTDLKEQEQKQYLNRVERWIQNLINRDLTDKAEEKIAHYRKCRKFALGYDQILASLDTQQLGLFG